jgi:MFS family permease
VSFPAYASLNSRWIPRSEYSRAQTLSLSGAYLGQTLSYPITTWLVLTFSWPIAFYFNAFVGAVWMLVWLVFATNSPAEHPKITPGELQEIQKNLAPRLTHAVSPWTVLRSPQVLLLSLSYLLLVYGLWLIVFWTPTYMVKARGFSMQMVGWIGMVPTIASFAGLVSGGVLSDALLRRGFSARFARVQGPALCIACAVPFLVAAALVPWSGVAIICLALYLFLSNAAGGGFWAMPLELNPQAVGAISGVMNCAGNFAGIFGPMTAGFLVTATGNWALPLLIVAGFAVASFLVFYFLVLPEPIELDTQVPEMVAQEARG